MLISTVLVYTHMDSQCVSYELSMGLVRMRDQPQRL